jgi:hypothetical protein
MVTRNEPITGQERLERLVLTTSALITETSLDAVLDRVVLVAAEVIGARYAAIGVLGPDGRLLERFVTHGHRRGAPGQDRPAAPRPRDPRAGHQGGQADQASRSRPPP